MKKVFNIIQTILIITYCIPIISAAIIVGIFSSEGMKWMAMKIWSPMLLSIVGARVKVVGKEKLDANDPCIYVANHSSHFDIPVMYANIDFFLHFIAKIELKKMPLFGWSCTMVDTIWIDRKDKDKARESLKQAGDHIRKGLNVISFPEGTRSKTGEINLFRKGSFLLAQQANIDITPVYIKGTRPLNPPGSFSFSPSDVTIVIGDRLKIEDYQNHTPEEFANEAQQIVLKMQEQFG